MASKFSESFVLGIDLGTTSIKTVVVNIQSEEVIYECSRIHNSYITFTDIKSEQDAKCIIEVVNECVAGIASDLAKKIIGIGVCGQLHGIVCWNSEFKPWTSSEGSRSISSNLITSHYNWQDNRCTSKFLETLPKPDSHLTLHSGYGCCTLFWLMKYSPETIEKMNRCGTIADLLVAILCDLDLLKMSTQVAASWGYFETKSNTWNEEILQSKGFPVHLLPEIVQPETIAGNLKEPWYNLSPGIPIGVALGDMHSYVFAALRYDTTSAMCNFSTSAQMAFILEDFDPKSGESMKTKAKIVPYFHGSYVVEAAALTGGNTISAFVGHLQEFFSQCDLNIKTDDLWKRLIELASSPVGETDLKFDPVFLGERHKPDSRGKIENMKMNNFHVAQIFRSLCTGVISNLEKISPVQFLQENKIMKILASGSALLRNRVLQMELEKTFPFLIEYTYVADSPYGSALSMIKALEKFDSHYNNLQ